MAYNASLGYDPDKDYSLAIRNATSDAEIKQLQAERQNKIDAVYGGNDPYTTPTVNQITGNATTPTNTSALYGSTWNPQTATAADSQAYRELQEAAMPPTDLGPAVKEETTPVVIPNPGAGGTGTGTTAEIPGYTDMTEYLKELYAQNLEAELGALESAYNQNVTALEAQQGEIAKQYQAARNQQAAQNETERMRFNEYANAQGLNSGTAGQGALAQSAAYQGAMADIGSQEAASLSDNQLALAQLLAEYNGNVQQSKAASNAGLAEALYNELLRQQEWDYNQSVYQNELAAAARNDAYNRAMTMLSYGVMPDSATLSQAGISGTEAAGMWQAALSGMDVGTAALSPSGSYSSGSTSGSSSGSSAGSSASSGSSAGSGASSGSSGSKNSGTSGATYSYDALVADLAAMRSGGESGATINNVINAALAAGTITSAEAVQLRGAYVGSGR